MSRNSVLRCYSRDVNNVLKAAGFHIPEGNDLLAGRARIACITSRSGRVHQCGTRKYSRGHVGDNFVRPFIAGARCDSGRCRRNLRKRNRGNTECFMNLWHTIYHCDEKSFHVVSSLYFGTDFLRKKESVL